MRMFSCVSIGNYIHVFKNKHILNYKGLAAGIWRQQAMWSYFLYFFYCSLKRVFLVMCSPIIANPSRTSEVYTVCNWRVHISTK